MRRIGIRRHDVLLALVPSKAEVDDGSHEAPGLARPHNADGLLSFLA
jgi:hypothetical protein